MMHLPVFLYSLILMGLMHALNLSKFHQPPKNSWPVLVLCPPVSLQSLSLLVPITLFSFYLKLSNT